MISPNYRLIGAGSGNRVQQNHKSTRNTVSNVSFGSQWYLRPDGGVTLVLEKNEGKPKDDEKLFIEFINEIKKGKDSDKAIDDFLNQTNITKAIIEGAENQIDKKEIAQLGLKTGFLKGRPFDIDAHNFNSGECLNKLKEIDILTVTNPSNDASHIIPVKLSETMTNNTMQTSSGKQVISEMPINKWDPKNLEDVAGMKEVKEKLKKSIIDILKDPIIQDIKDDYDVELPNGTLFIGPPRCGKTYFVKALAGELDCPIYELNLAKLGMGVIHESSQNMRKVFDTVEERAKKEGKPCILFVDEMGALGGKRSGINIHNSIIEETETFLKLSDNSAKKGIILIGATNEPELIDDAVMSSGRFTQHIYVGLPDLEARTELMKKFLSRMKAGKEFSEENEKLKNLAKDMEGLSMADITEQILKPAKNKALYETIAIRRSNPTSTEIIPISERHVKEILNNLKETRSDLFKKDLSKYTKYHVPESNEDLKKYIL